FQAEDGIRDRNVTGVQTCALPILRSNIIINPFLSDCSLNKTKSFFIIFLTAFCPRFLEMQKATVPPIKEPNKVNSVPLYKPKIIPPAITITESGNKRRGRIESIPK